MNNVLGRKQRIANSDWIEAFEKIEQLITKDEMDQLVEHTVKEIKERINGKKAAFAWSGGKDSLVLGEICRKAGIYDCMMAVCDLEYPAFMQWVEGHKPENLEIINTGQNIEWLKKHPDMLFPKDSGSAARWFSIVQHRAQEKYYKNHQLEMILLGRRKADGNYCGRGENIYTNGKGITRYSPLADWKHEEILGYIHYYNIPMPPIYEWKNGYLCGTHPWPARQWTGSLENAWAEIYEIDQSIVHEAAQEIESARIYLNSFACR